MINYMNFLLKSNDKLFKITDYQDKIIQRCTKEDLQRQENMNEFLEQISIGNND